MAETAQAVEEKQDQQNADAKTQAQSVELSEATDSAAGGAGGSIDILLDMNVPVTVAIGKKEIPVRRLLQLGPGSVLTLDKSIDSPVELYLKDTLFAAGEVVVVDSRFAVKIKQVLGVDNSTASPAEA